MTVTVGDLQRRVVRGIGWKAASAVFSQLTRLATAIVLARLLAPHDYGLAGMVLIAAGLVYIFSDLALGTALVQRRALTEADRSTVFWTSTTVGLLLTLAGIALAGPIARFYGEPQVRPLFAAFSLSFVVTAVSSTQAALLTREMDFRTLELRRMVATAFGAVVGIGLALEGAGAWALIAQQLTIALVSTVLLMLLATWRPRLLYSIKSLRSFAGFSGNVFGTQVLFYVNRNLDNLLVGRFLGPAALGAYSISYNVMLMPFSQIASPVQEVVFPAFARLQDDPKRIASGWLRANRLVGALTIPSLLGLMVVAPDFVSVFLGPRWHSAVPVVQILAWVGLLQSLQRFNSSILEARNETGLLIRYSAIALTASAIAFAAGLPFGIVGVSAAYAISSTFVEPYYAWLTGRTIDVKLRTFIESFTSIVTASVLMAGCVFGARVALVHAGVPAGGRLPLLIALGMLIYIPTCLNLDRELAAEIDTLRRSRASAQPVAIGSA